MTRRTYHDQRTKGNLLYRESLKKLASTTEALRLNLLTSAEYAPRISAQNQLKKMALSAVLLHDLFRQARDVA